MTSNTLHSGAAEQARTDTSQYLTFMLAGEEYGVEILRVQGIQGWESATPIPNSPEYVLGVMNLRGAIVPIVDLRKRFGMESIEFGPTTVNIVLKVENEDQNRTVGIVVDAVSEVYPLDEETIQPAPAMGSANTGFIKGLADVEGKMVILLDVDKILDVNDTKAQGASEDNDAGAQ